MSDINILVHTYLEEGLGDHLKKHWKKYAVGALAAGAMAPQAKMAYHGVQAKRHLNKLKSGGKTLGANALSGATSGYTSRMSKSKSPIVRGAGNLIKGAIDKHTDPKPKMGVGDLAHHADRFAHHSGKALNLKNSTKNVFHLTGINKLIKVPHEGKVKKALDTYNTTVGNK